MGSLCKSCFNPCQLLEHNEGKPTRPANLWWMPLPQEIENPFVRSSTFNILHTPASHGIHLQVDVLNVAKGTEVLLDVCVLCLLRRMIQKSDLAPTSGKRSFQILRICYYTLSTTKHRYFSRLEKAMISMAPLRGCNFTERKIQLRTRCLWKTIDIQDCGKVYLG